MTAPNHQQQTDPSRKSTHHKKNQFASINIIFNLNDLAIKLLKTMSINIIGETKQIHRLCSNIYHYRNRCNGVDVDINYEV